jgi:site-specific recombinase XerD
MFINILSQQFFDYSRYEKNYSPKTIRRYKQVLAYYCKSANVNQIEDVTRENVRNLFYFGRSEKNWSSNTYHSYYKSLRVFFRWCKNNGYLSINPTDDLELPKIEKSLPKALSKQQAERILEIVDNYPFENSFLRYRNYAIFATLIFTGIRKEELLNLKYNDIDIENQSIFIRMGKGRKDRILPMNYRLAEALERYKEARKRALKTCPEFFTSYTYDMGFTESGLKRLVVKMRKATGNYFGNHILRHTFATLMLEGGCDLYSLSKMLGHNDIKTTTIYLSASVEHLRNQMLKHPLN